MTTAVKNETEKAERLFKNLYLHIRAFEKAQGAVKRRFKNITQGTLSVKRKPVGDVIKHRDQARANFGEFLDGLSEEEKEILTIARGPNWRSEYDDIFDPANDPQFV